MFAFHICDYHGNTEKCTIHRSDIRIRRIQCSSRLPSANSTCIYNTDPVKLVDFLLDLRFYPRFRLKIANAIANRDPAETITFKLVPPQKEFLDYHWGERVQHLLWERIELTELMAWLSTLGGAFSALGDYELACADTAGKISAHQMKLALRLGDPSLVARCKLYFAISLIQREEFAAAKHIVQTVYRTEKKEKVPEVRLLKMCQGIWAKLRYEYEAHQTNQARKKT